LHELPANSIYVKLIFKGYTLYKRHFKICNTQYVRVIKSRRMRWMGGACSADGEGRVVYRVLVGKPGGKSHLGDPGVDGRIILRWIFRKWDVGVWTGVNWLRIETGGGHL
jgi:hypothetical protein